MREWRSKLLQFSLKSTSEDFAVSTSFLSSLPTPSPEQLKPGFLRKLIKFSTCLLINPMQNLTVFITQMTTMLLMLLLLHFQPQKPNPLVHLQLKNSPCCCSLLTYEDSPRTHH